VAAYDAAGNVSAQSSAASATTQAPGAAFNYVLGDTNYTYPTTVPQPAKGQSITDPTFNTTITRITNHAAEVPSCDHVGSEYGTWSPLSADGNYLLFECGQGGYGLWDAHTYAFIKTISMTSQGCQNPEPRWDRSGSNPTRIYYRAGYQERYFDALTEN